MKEIQNVDIIRVKGDILQREEDIVIVEYPFTLFIEDKEIITLLCSPSSLEYLALGFLYSEGFIDSLEDITKINIDKEKGICNIKLYNVNKLRDNLRGKRTITSGCGKGTLFYNVLDSFKSQKVENILPIEIEKIKLLVREFNRKSELFKDTGGVHSCALCNYDEILIFEEDIGRHNALDKVFGRALAENINTLDKIIFTSGRISSEILIKAAKRQVPIIVSRSAPTSLSIELGEELGISLIGFARGEKMNIYTNKKGGGFL
ncbi:MAG: formate dehydrogenase accessory sulfurtransferase FdhD [Tissierellia bacterium]|nr:formate dehydrogenase accessory sulfurtransferase FdhD [Tissierellia bacterium]